MKKELVITLFLLNLFPYIHNGSIMIGFSTISAQSMGNEYDTYDCDDDEYGSYTSPFPCDEEPCFSPCPQCDETLLCDMFESHMLAFHNSGGYDWNADGENTFDNSGDSGEVPGGGNNPWSEDGYGSGNSVIEPGNSQSYIIGMTAWNKIASDIEDNNYSVYIGTIDDNNSKLINSMEFLSRSSLDATIVDKVVEQFPKLNKNPIYTALGKSLGAMGVGIGMADTALILVNNGGDLSTGDVLSIASDVTCGVGFWLELVPFTHPVGVLFTATGIVCGIVSLYVDEIDIPLENGMVLHLKKMKA